MSEWNQYDVDVEGGHPTFWRLSLNSALAIEVYEYEQAFRFFLVNNHGASLYSGEFLNDGRVDADYVKQQSLLAVNGWLREAASVAYQRYNATQLAYALSPAGKADTENFLKEVNERLIAEGVEPFDLSDPVHKKLDMTMEDNNDLPYDYLEDTMRVKENLELRVHSEKELWDEDE